MLSRFLGRAHAKVHNPDYDLLPTSEWSTPPSIKISPIGWVKRRRRLVFACILILVSVIAIALYSRQHPQFWRRKFVLKIFGPKELPPLYPEWKEAEAALPQHSSREPFAGGRKYLWVASHTWWSGWGNFMQDMILTAQLTYVTGRAYVFVSL